MGPRYGLDIRFTDSHSQPFNYRVVLSAEGSSTWDFAHGNIVVMNPEAKVLFTVTRAKRWTAKGAVSAMSKEFVKVRARYLDIPRGFKWRSELSDGQVRELQQKGGNANPLPEPKNDAHKSRNRLKQDSL